MGEYLFQSLAIAILVEFIVALTYYLIKNEHLRIIVLGVGTVLAFVIGFIVPSIIRNLGFTSPSKDTLNDFSNALDCSETTEIGPWLTLSEVIFNPDRDGWVQADFWSSSGQLIEGYDEVSVIFEPSLRVIVSDVQGIAWHYDKSLWNQRDVEWCTQKHVPSAAGLTPTRPPFRGRYFK